MHRIQLTKKSKSHNTLPHPEHYPTMRGWKVSRFSSCPDTDYFPKIKGKRHSYLCTQKQINSGLWFWALFTSTSSGLINPRYLVKRQSQTETLRNTTGSWQYNGKSMALQSRKILSSNTSKFHNHSCNLNLVIWKVTINNVCFIK